MFEKKFLLIFAALAVCALIVAGCVNATPEKPVVQEKRVAIVSGHWDWAPVMYLSKDGTSIEGSGVNMTRDAFKSIGVDVISKNVGSWSDVQEKARTGEIDAIVALYKTKEREEYLYYSDWYAVDPISLFFKSGKGFVYDRKESLIGKKGVATKGDSYGQEMDDFIIQANLSILRVDTPEQAFALIKDEKADYFIYSLYAGRKVINESGLSGFEESKEVVSEQLFYIGVSKKSPYAKYMNEINSSLKKQTADRKVPKN
jgi:ABC-type amino acid transport substrate-binding protein